MPAPFQENHKKTVEEERPQRNAAGMFSTVVRPERAILARFVATDNSRASGHADAVEPQIEVDPLAELQGLAEAATAVVVERVEQRRATPHPATLFGKGKVEEFAILCRDTEADVFIVDCDLTPAQGRNLESALKLRVIDRTELILDIFARRAQTRQAKLQVELAQLRYQLPRLKRLWTHLDAQSGGSIGLRGPGETQLETDKRLAADRIVLLQKQLDEIRQQKMVEGWGRKEFETGALVGYTNVGKSALLNALCAPTGKGVLVKDQLFATLGAATRRVELGGGRDVLMSDTVGFVRRLPHHLVESFHSTLAEVQNADFMLHVISAADEERDDKMRAVEKVLTELEAKAPTILVVNQIDRLSGEELSALRERHPEAAFTSALTHEGLDALRERIFALMDASAEDVELTLDGRDENVGRVLSELARHGRVISQEWESDVNDGVAPRLKVRARLAPRWRDYISVSPRAFKLAA